MPRIAQHGFSLIFYAVLALAVLGTLSDIAWKIREAGADSIRLEWAEANVEARKREQEASDKAAAELEAERQKKKVVIQKRTVYVDKIVERAVYRNVCLDPDGLRCINAAIVGKDEAGCKPDLAMPSSEPPA